MKEKIKKILNPGFLIILLTIILVFTLTTYWKIEANRSWRQLAEKNNIIEREMSTAEANYWLNYKIYYWDLIYRKIWTYDLLILASGVLLFIVLKRNNKEEKDNPQVMKESTKKRLQGLLVEALKERKLEEEK